MRYRLQRHDGTDCSATMVPITVLRMVPIQRYRQILGPQGILLQIIKSMNLVKSPIPLTLQNHRCMTCITEM